MAHKAKKISIWMVLILTMSALALVVFLFSYKQVYAGKIYKNVYFGDVDLSGMTKKQAYSLLKTKFQKVLNKEITFNANNKEVKVKLSDTGLTFDLNKAIESSYTIGRDSNFFTSLFESGKTVFLKKQVEIAPTIDQAKYNDFLKISIDQLNIQPADATISLNNGEVLITDGNDGQTVVTDNLSNKIIGMISNESTSIKMETTIIPAQVKNADFTAVKASATDYLNKKIIFTFIGKNFEPSQKDISLWLELNNKNGQYSIGLDDSNIKTYLNQIASNFEIQKKDNKINALTGAKIEEGRQGLYLDKDKTLADLKSKISGSNIQVDLVTYTEDPGQVSVIPNEGLVPGKFEGKYIDIDLTTQTLCEVQGLNVGDCFPVSSGKPSTPTPPGTYTIIEKSPRRWSNEFSMWLPWWNEFDARGYGIHELPETATWKEVPDHLGTPVSHGCVRLGVGPAESVYNWTEMGTPVYIHK